MPQHGLSLWLKQISRYVMVQEIFLYAIQFILLLAGTLCILILNYLFTEILFMTAIPLWNDIQKHIGKRCLI